MRYLRRYWWAVPAWVLVQLFLGPPLTAAMLSLWAYAFALYRGLP